MNEIINADGEGCQLSWTRRMKIIIGIARGLKYLHNEIEPPFTISELNSNAVYLTEDFSPKVCVHASSLSYNYDCAEYLTALKNKDDSQLAYTYVLCYFSDCNEP